MTDKEKLVEIVRGAYDKSLSAVCLNGCGCRDDKLACKRCQDDMLADHLLANSVTIQRWISVEERLPEPFDTVLAHDATREQVVPAYITRHNEWVGVPLNTKVPHWMPLPEAPKGE